MHWPKGLVAPREIRDLAMGGQVRRVCRPDVTAETMRVVAQRIWGWHKPQGTPLDQFQQYLNLILTVDTESNARPGHSSEQARSNSLCLSLTHLAAAELTMSNEIALVALQARDLVERLANQGNGEAGWWYIKLETFLRRYATRWKTVSVLKKLDSDEVQHWVALSEGGNITAMGDEIAAGIAQVRAYGVKPCVIEDGILHPLGTGWIFADGYDSRNRLKADMDLGHLAPVLADTYLAKTREIRNTTSIAPTIQNEKSEAVTYRSFGMTVRPMMDVSIFENGALSVDPDIGVVPAAAYFREAGMEGVYPMFRLVHLLRLCDLVVPVEAARKHGVPSWPVRPTRRRERKAMQLRNIPFLRTLVVPRLRLLGNRAGLDAAHLQELADSVIKTEQLTRKRMGRHDVVGFLRPLPVGFTASGRARDLALQERGIRQIPDGWTYVRSHERGSEANNSAGHIAHRPNS